MVGKGLEHPRGGCHTIVRFWGKIEFFVFYSSRIGFIRIFPNRSFSGNGSGLAVGGLGRGHHRCEFCRLLSGGSPHVVKFSEELRFLRSGYARFFVSFVLALDTFNHKTG